MPSYTGTVHFTKSDTGVGSAVPTDYTFVPGDLGVHKFTNGVTLVTSGPQTITATDTSANFSATSPTITVNPTTANHLTVSAPSPATAGVAST